MHAQTHAGGLMFSVLMLAESLAPEVTAPAAPRLPAMIPAAAPTPEPVVPMAMTVLPAPAPLPAPISAFIPALAPPVMVTASGPAPAVAPGTQRLTVMEISSLISQDSIDPVLSPM